MLAALAVLLIVGGAVTAGLLALRADTRVPVLVATRDIAAGEQITADMLASTPVAAEGTLLVPASQIDLVVGQHARVIVTAGQLLDTAMITASAPLQPGLLAVGAALGSGRMPASGLQAGDLVRLVHVGDGGGEVIVDARVSSFRPSESAGGASAATVTFIVPEASAPTVATVAAVGELAVLLVERGTPQEG